MPTKTWSGKSGNPYVFKIYDWDVELPTNGGVYIVVKDDKPIYVGESGDFDDRISKDHHKYDCITNKNPTHIHLHDEPVRSKRLKIERDILNKHPTNCND